MTIVCLPIFCVQWSVSSWSDRCSPSDNRLPIGRFVLLLSMLRHLQAPKISPSRSFILQSFIHSVIYIRAIIHSFIHSLIQSASQLYSVNYSFIHTGSSHSFTHSASKPVSRIGSIIHSFIQPASTSVILGQLESVIKPVRCAVSSSFSALIITSILVC